ncbi:chromosomal replication initiator protein DnaA [Synechococcus sp. PCC 7336]|uniref:chromosomal replication initiator protein DnaA n=1 Tax=Synechococcus sp. PCC 7336 TaxID=195250 RepID=UPI0004781AF3|nr:chromosomal replication initiator protein DnaA [Synechococcus sp. PCC 7336]
MTLSAEQLWDQVLSHLQVQLSRPTFETWIKTARAESLTEHCLTIQTPNTFARNWLQKNYVTTIATVVEGIVGSPLEIAISVSSGESNGKGEPADLPSAPVAPPLPVLEAKPTTTRTRAVELNPKYTFSRFVVGSNNRMAHAAALAVAEMPGRAYNPLFLCGGVGLGKTHLMQAIGQYRLESDPNTKIFYVSTERFTNDLIDAIRRDSMQAFREHYRDVDILMVDDIQFIEGKEYTQEEFFHTFNTLHERGKQIVLCSDRSPHLIPRLQERLCSRFSMGLIAEIQSPDIETRMAILQKKAEYEGMHLPPEVIEYIASRYTNNIRELEGALIRAVAFVSISGLAMAVENIDPILNPPTKSREVTPNVVIETICEEYKLSEADLKGNSRKREISQARQVAMFLMRHYTDLSLPKIGEAFGGKDHTTVIYSCEKVAQMQKKDPQLARQIQQLGDRLRIAANTP